MSPEPDLERAFGKQARRVHLIEGDIGSEATAKRAVTETIERFGQLDGVVSNAGIMIRKPIRQLTIAEWRRVLDVNLTAAFLLAKAAERPLTQTKGAFVSIASTRAAMSEPNTEAYSASKGGLVALTHALAMSLAPVRVNCVSPGWIATKDYDKLRRKDHAQHPGGPRRQAGGYRRDRRLAARRRALRLRHRSELHRRRRHDAEDDLRRVGLGELRGVGVIVLSFGHEMPRPKGLQLFTAPAVRPDTM